MEVEEVKNGRNGTSKVAAKTKQNEPMGFCNDDDEEIPRATEQQKEAQKLSEDEDVEMKPVRRRANKKRRVQQESSVDEDEMAAAPQQDVNMVDEQQERTPQKNIFKQLASENNDPNLRLSEEPTSVTPDKKPNRAAAPGKKWVKVKKTE